MAVLAVMRRFRRDRTTRHSPRRRWISTTLTPWAAWERRTISRVQFGFSVVSQVLAWATPVCSSASSVYSWFTQSTPRSSPSRGK